MLIERLKKKFDSRSENFRTADLKVALAAVILGAFATGCATAEKPSILGLFRESASDIQDRAPASMAVGRAGDASDSIHVQSQADYHFALAEAHSLEGSSARAVEEYKLALLYDPNSAQVRTRLANEYARQGLVSEALEQAKESVKMDPRQTEAHFVLGAIHSGLRLYDEAIGNYEAILAADADNPEAQLYIGAIYAEQKDYPKALTQFHLLAQNQNNTNAHMAWYYVGRVLSEKSQIQNLKKAEDAFHKAISLKGSYLEPVLALGQLHEASGQPAKAIGVYSSYQTKHGSNPMVAEALARLHLERSEWLKAYDQLRVIEASDPEDLNVKMRIAFVFVETKKYQEAVEKLEEILAQAPNSDKVRYYLAAVFEEIRDMKSAISHFAKIGPESSYYSEAIVHMTYLHKISGDYGKALSAVEEGIKKKPDNSQFYALQASLLDEQKNYDRAHQVLKVAVERFPDNTQILFFYGANSDRMGRKEDTERTMRDVLKQDPNHVQALNYLAYLLADFGRNLEEAESLARRANELQPNDGFILDTLGWVIFKKGRVEEAIRWLELAHSVQPNEAIIAEHLGDAYYHHKMPERARQMYARAAESESNAAKGDPGNVEKIRRKLASIDLQKSTIAPDESLDKIRRPASRPEK